MVELRDWQLSDHDIVSTNQFPRISFQNLSFQNLSFQNLSFHNLSFHNFPATTTRRNGTRRRCRISYDRLRRGPRIVLP